MDESTGIVSLTVELLGRICGEVEISFNDSPFNSTGTMADDVYICWEQTFTYCHSCINMIYFKSEALIYYSWRLRFDDRPTSDTDY